jgi:ABC-type lipoprotein release transport system permease subunit
LEARAKRFGNHYGLFDLTPLDPTTWAGVSLLFAAVAACVPARRAMTIDPVRELRAE